MFTMLPLSRLSLSFLFLLSLLLLRQNAVLAEEPEGDDAKKLDDYYYNKNYDANGQYDGNGGYAGSGYSSSAYQQQGGEKITYWTDYAIFPKRCIV
jgi:hypothetical protein